MKNWSYILAVFIFSCTSPSKQSYEMKVNKAVPNHLINETSPYLQQHAYNPVEWYPWNEEALVKAKKEDKMLLISIGYSACHWCHVMEHESFEDTSVAAIMNKYFINIKIDREERPDIDQVYMSAVQLMNKGRGGWPLNTIALPDGRPIFGGTYFPKDRWISILKQIGEVYQNDRSKVIGYAEKITEGITSVDQLIPNKYALPFTKEYLIKTVENWKRAFDNKNGGPNRSPKFPLPNNYEFLLDYGILNEDIEVLNHVALTLDKMAMGGIYDQVGGGFARYSTDEIWKVPHFEKMLYDNAQLISLYSKAYRYFKKVEYKHVVVQTIEFLKRELKGSQLYHSALDADSEGEEGKFYVWRKEDIKRLLGTDFEKLAKLYNVNGKGLWEAESYIFLRDKTLDNLSVKDRAFLIRSNKVLLKERAKRVRPGLDDKSIVAWNALLLTAYVDAYNAFGTLSYLEEAKWISSQIDKRCYSKGKLTRILNKQDGPEAFLDDYVFWVEGLLGLYECTFDEGYLNKANELISTVNRDFSDASSAMYFYYSQLGEQLIHRPKEISDNVIPASNSTLAKVLSRLGMHLGNKIYKAQSLQMLLAIKPSVERYGSGYSNWLSLANNLVFGHKEVVFTGVKALEYRNEFIKEYNPNVLIAGAIKSSNLPLLENRITDNTFIYVCKNGACSLPLEKIENVFQAIK